MIIGKVLPTGTLIASNLTLKGAKGDKGDKGDKGNPGSIKFIIVNQLPTEDIDESAIYLVPVQDPQTLNTYEEYIYANNTWEKLGGITPTIDLSGYATKDDIKVIFNDGEQTYTWTTSQDMFNYIATNIGNAIQTIFDDLDKKQTKSNMESTINSSSTDYKYPSSYAVYNYVSTQVGNIETILNNLNSGGGV